MSEENKVPAIRFEGFGGEWDECELGKYSTIKGRLGWKSLKQKEYLDVGPSMIAGRHITDGVINWKIVDHIPEWRYFESPEIMLKNNDVIFSKDGSLGNPSIIKNLQGRATINSTMMLVRPRKNLVSDFFFQILKTKSFSTLIQLKVSGSSIPHLFQADMNKFMFDFPQSKHEQTKIGDYFQQLDTLIAQHQKKHDKLLNFKKALLEKMFPKGEANDELGRLNAESNTADHSASSTQNASFNTPAIRFKGFSGEWREGVLEEICSYHTSSLSVSNAKIDGKYKLYDVNKIIGYTDCNVQNHKYITIIKDGAGVGRLRLLPKNTSFIGTMGGIQSKESDIQFLLYCLMKIDFSKHITGSTIPHIYFSSYSKDICLIPKVGEQTKIGKLFKQLDTLLNQHQTQLKKLNNIKQACLEKMFV